MRQVSLGGNLTYLKAGDYDRVRGVYVESEPSKNFPDQMGHVLDTESGRVLLNGTGSLNSFFKTVTPGTVVEIHYRGKEKIEKGQWAGKSAHTFEFFVDDDALVNTPEPTQPEPTSPVTPKPATKKVF